MSAQNPSFALEAKNAVQGSWRILIGRRDAPAYFTTDMRGLVSSFIALVISVAVTLAFSALGPQAEGMLTSFAVLFTNAVLYALLVAASWVTLRLLGHLDKFVAYLTADNWVNAVISLVLAVLSPVLAGNDALFLVALVVGLIARINIARLVVGLKAWGILALIMGQAVGMMIGLLVIGAMLAPAIQ